MRTRGFVLALALGVSGMAAAEPARLPSQKFLLQPLDAAATYQVTPPDIAKLLAEDQVAAKSRPLRFAQRYDVRLTAFAQGKSNAGRWETLPDGRLAWRLAIEAPGALSVNVGFARMFLPQGTEMYFASADGKSLRGPWTDRDNTRSGIFYTPIVHGERALIELTVPAELRQFVVLEIESINYGYRDIFAPSRSKSGTCNVDSVCPQGDPIRDQIRAEATYSSNGQFLCSGQLLNNTAQNGRRLFSTANHCRVQGANTAPGMVLYWRYESPVCRTVGSVENGNPLPLAGNSITQTGGATDLAFETDSDFWLVELNTPVPGAANPFFDGWDRRETGFPSARVVHHPSTDEKRISFENQALTVNNTAISGLPGTKHWRVADWDVGTTEPGSSGSGLLSPDNRVIGFLSGGQAACGNELDDYFGRLGFGWDGDGTATTRLRDHLDPTGGNPQFLDGRGACTAPTVQVTGPASGNAGTPVTFTASITGGVAPYRVDWDVDNDGFTDRSVSNVAGGTQISPNFPTAFSTNVVARVTDATGCAGQGQAALNIGAPDLVPTAQAAQQVCGDGDAAIEPGESWRVPVSLFNSGGQALSGGYAVFAEPQSSGGATTPIGPDGFGYRAGDETTGCAYNFLDLDGQVAAQTLTAAGTVAAEDDGRTAPLLLGSNFSFYGQTLTQLVMSTNGYLSGGAGESGGDYDNACGLVQPDRGSVPPRLNVFHDDLVVRSTLTNAGLRAATANPCPRPAESGASSCIIFQWSRMGLFSGGGTPTGDFDVQAILYPATGQIVYQYRENPPDTGASATVGTLNASVSQGLQYSCNQGNTIRDGRAICILNPQFPPLGASTADNLRNDTPAVALNNLASGQTQVVNAEFRVSPTAQCGSNVRLDYVATVDANAWSQRSTTVLNATLGAGGACQVASCAAAAASGAKGAAPAITPRQGLFANPKRFGNGIGSFVIATSPTPTYFGLWFTGQQNRNPTWYAIQGPYVDNQAIAPVLRFTNTAAPNGFSVSSTQVGTAQITFVNPTTYIFTSTVDGGFQGEIQSVLYPGTRPTPNRTAAWYPPAESGWGTVFDDHFLGATPEQVGINYIYGTDGTARWALGASAELNSGSQGQNSFLVHCPDCPNFNDFGSFPLVSGAITRTFSSQTAGTISTTITIPSPAPSSFNRTNVPFQMLTTPQPPQ